MRAHSKNPSFVVSSRASHVVNPWMDNPAPTSTATETPSSPSSSHFSLCFVSSCVLHFQHLRFNLEMGKAAVEVFLGVLVVGVLLELDLGVAAQVAFVKANFETRCLRDRLVKG
jgi:hypothetical protein